MADFLIWWFITSTRFRHQQYFAVYWNEETFVWSKKKFELSKRVCLNCTNCKYVRTITLFSFKVFFFFKNSSGRLLIFVKQDTRVLCQVFLLQLHQKHKNVDPKQISVGSQHVLLNRLRGKRKTVRKKKCLALSLRRIYIGVRCFQTRARVCAILISFHAVVRLFIIQAPE